MKVLHIVMSLNIGGLEKMVIEMVNRMLRAGIEAHILCLFEGGVWREKVPEKNLHILNTYSAMRLITHTVKFIKKGKFDLVHTHNPKPHLIGGISARLCGVPLVHTKHGRNYPNNSVRVFLNRMLAYITDYIVAVSDDSAVVARDIEGISSEKVRVIKNGVDTEKFKFDEEIRRKIRQELFGDDEKLFVAGSVGRFVPEKNYSNFIKSAVIAKENLASRGIRLAILLVGDGPEKKALIENAKELEGSIFISGWTERVREYLCAMDIFCLPSRTEGTSVTLLEACSTGVVPVVTDTGGNREVVKDGITGFVVSFSSSFIENFASAIVKLALNKDMRIKMGEQARQYVKEHYNIDDTILKYLSLYRDVLNKRSKTFK